MKKIYLLLSLSLICFLNACDRFPTDKLVSPNVDGTTGWGSVWTLYNNTIQTRGNPGPIMFTNWVVRDQGSVDMENSDEKWHGNRSIRVDWTGADNEWYSGGTATQASFGLEARPGEGGARPSYNFTPGNYTKLKFFVKGNLWDNVYLRVETGNNVEGINKPLAVNVYPASAGSPVGLQDWPSPISNSWQEVEITIPPVQVDLMDAVEYVLVISLVNATEQPCTGGTVYLANIRLVRE
jgi:hypothetical protein